MELELDPTYVGVYHGNKAVLLYSPSGWCQALKLPARLKVVAATYQYDPGPCVHLWT